LDVGTPYKNYFTALASEISAGRTVEYNSQGLANLAWAFATTGGAPSEIYQVFKEPKKHSSNTGARANNPLQVTILQANNTLQASRPPHREAC